MLPRDRPARSRVTTLTSITTRPRLGRRPSGCATGWTSAFPSRSAAGMTQKSVRTTGHVPGRLRRGVMQPAGHATSAGCRPHCTRTGRRRSCRMRTCRCRDGPSRRRVRDVAASERSRSRMPAELCRSAPSSAERPPVASGRALLQARALDSHPSLNSACRKSLTALRASSAVAGLPPTCGLSSMQASL